MAALPPPPGYGLYTRTFQCVSGGKPMTNTWGFQNTTAQSAAIVVGAVRTASTSAGSIYNPAQYTNSYEAVGDYCIVNLAGLLSSQASIFAVAGTSTFDAVGPATSAVVRKVTNFAGRQYRGRVALPACFIDEAGVDEVGDLSGQEAALQTAANIFRTNANTAGYPLVLLHQIAMGAVSAPAPTPILNLLVDKWVGTQRKRQTRR